MAEKNLNTTAGTLSTEEDYNEILQQAVAVIDTARKAIATQMATATTGTYWEIGKLLYDRKVESKHGSSVIKRLSADLKDKFPSMVFLLASFGT